MLFLALLSRRLMDELIVYQRLWHPSVNIFKHLLKTTGPIELKFHMETPKDGGMKVVLVTLPGWPPCPYMVKTL